MIVEMGDWAVASRILGTPPVALARIIDVVVRDEADHFAEKVREGLTSQAPGGRKIRPPSTSTILSRRMAGVRGSLALISTGKLLRAIKSKRLGRGEYFAGVPRGSRSGSSGVDLAEIARINEEGMGPIVVRITPKMRRFLHALYRRSGDPAGRGGERPGFVVIRIPARPFVRPVAERELAPARLVPRVCARVAQLTGGDFGTA